MRADVLSLRARDGEPKYVIVGRGTFVIFADDRGIWGIDIEAEEWDDDPGEIFNKIKIEDSGILRRLDELSRLMPPRRMQPSPYLPLEWRHDG